MWAWGLVKARKTIVRQRKISPQGNDETGDTLEADKKEITEEERVKASSLDSFRAIRTLHLVP
jgi:hypothetical protein